MKKIKQLAALCIAAVMMVSVAGCKSKESKSSSVSDSSYPKKTITLLVPAAAGGDTDLRARLMGRYLEKELGKSVVIINASGGATSAATIKLKQSAADGYTMLFSHNSMLTNELFGTTDFGHKDLTVIGSAYRAGDNGIITHKNAKYKKVEDIIQQLKKEPKSISFGTETGGNTYLTILAMEKTLGVQFNIVDAGDGAQRTAAMMGGQIDLMMGALNTYPDYYKTGDFIPLACVNTGTGLKVDAPTFKKLGYDFDMPDMLYSVFMPAGVPKEVVSIVDKALEKVIKNNDFIKEAEKLNAVPSYMNSADATAFYDKARDYYFSFKDIVDGAMKK